MGPQAWGACDRIQDPQQRQDATSVDATGLDGLLICWEISRFAEIPGHPCCWFWSRGPLPLLAHQSLQSTLTPKPYGLIDLKGRGSPAAEAEQARTDEFARFGKSEKKHPPDGENQGRSVPFSAQ